DVVYMVSYMCLQFIYALGYDPAGPMARLPLSSLTGCGNNGPSNCDANNSLPTCGMGSTERSSLFICCRGLHWSLNIFKAMWSTCGAWAASKMCTIDTTACDNMTTDCSVSYPVNSDSWANDTGTSSHNGYPKVGDCGSWTLPYTDTNCGDGSYKRLGSHAAAAASGAGLSVSLTCLADHSFQFAVSGNPRHSSGSKDSGAVE